jgi:putative transposase
VLVAEHRISRARACRIANLSRSAYYQGTVDRAQRDAPVVDALSEIIAKRVHRIYCRMRLNLKRRTRRRTFTRERQPLMAPNGLNKIWSVDFMHDTTYDGRTFRTFNVIDEGNREGLRIECGKSIPSARVVRVMEQLVEVYGRPDAIRLDNGPPSSTDIRVSR